MMTSFYNLLKYAATGQASPDMTYYDRMRASTLMGGAVKTLTGVPPLSFRANGKPLISWSMLGNSQQNGTPAPDAPITPTFCGKRTANLFDWSAVTTGYRITWATGELIEDASAIISNFIPMSVGVYRANASYNLVGYDAGKSYLGVYDPSTMTFRKEFGGKTSYYNITDTDVAYVKLMSFSKTDALSSATMFNLGITALPYEPYGWKIPVTSAGQTQAVYLGQTQTVRRNKKLVLTGQETNWIYEGEYERFGIPVYDMFVRGTRLVTLICSHYQCIDDGRAIGNVPNNSIYVVGGLTNMIFIKTNSYTTVDAFKNYLQEQYTNGTPVTIWYVLAMSETAIVNEPLAKIGTYADELHSTDAGVSIPTAKGANTLTVDTDLPPSEMTITYRG